MKNAKKILIYLLALALSFTVVFSLASCDEVYTVEETDSMIAEINDAITKNKTELDFKINALAAEYKAKDDALAAEIAADKAALAELKAKYDADLAVLNKTDADNKGAIESLTATYEAKVAELEASIAAANSKIDANKTELDATITALDKSCTEKTNELKALIKELEAADSTQNSAIKNLEEYFKAEIKKIEAKYEEEIKTLLDKIAELEKVEIYTVIFNSNCETEIASQTVTAGNLVTEPETPTNDGYEFLGWYLDDMKWEFDGYTVTKNITLSAKWSQRGTDGIKYSLGIGSEIELTVIGYDGSETDVVIPQSVNGYPVVKIENSAFESNNRVTSISIPDGVTSIGERAFRDCTSLTSITIPDSVNTIGDYAFRDCTSLTSVTIPDSVTAIGNYAFYNCTGLTSVTIGDSVTSIGENAFYDCGSLTSVTIPDSVTTIASSAFEGCTSLTSVTIGDSVTTIGEDAFYNCTGLIGVNITDVAAWCDIEFDGYSSNPLRYAGNLYLNGELVTELVIPDSVTSIGAYAFSSCDSLKSVTIPNSVTSIGSSAFSGCPIVTSTIPTTVISAIPKGKLKIVVITSGASIPNSAFASCTSLTSVTIGNSVTTIGSYAFSSCDSLTSITVSPENANYKDIDGNLYTKDGKTLIQYAIGKKDTSFTIPDSVTTIGSYAFSSCTSLRSVTIPDSVTTIGDSAFYNCYSITSVTIGNSVTMIGFAAFFNCDSLTSVTIGNGVTTIGDMAFYNCTSLTDVYYTETAKEWNKITIGSYNDALFNAYLHFFIEIIFSEDYDEMDDVIYGDLSKYETEEVWGDIYYDLTDRYFEIYDTNLYMGMYNHVTEIGTANNPVSYGDKVLMLNLGVDDYARYFFASEKGLNFGSKTLFTFDIYFDKTCMSNALFEIQAFLEGNAPTTILKFDFGYGDVYYNEENPDIKGPVVWYAPWDEYAKNFATKPVTIENFSPKLNTWYSVSIYLNADNEFCSICISDGAETVNISYFTPGATAITELECKGIFSRYETWFWEYIDDPENPIHSIIYLDNIEIYCNEPVPETPDEPGTPEVIS